MTTKTSEVVIDALENIVVQADEAPIEQSEARSVIRALNDMMATWAAKGIELGFTNVSDMADPITVAPGAILGIKLKLALVIAPKYEVNPSPSLIAAAKEAFDACIDLAVNMSESEYPSTLPRGSGNTYPTVMDDAFYQDREDTILTETGGSIALEDDTEEAS